MTHNVSIGSALTVGGNVTGAAFLYSSDRQMKTDIQPIEGPLDKVALLNGVSFRFIKDGDKGRRHVGVIAQDVEKVFPEAVLTDAKGMKSVDYPALVAPLIESVKQLKAANDNLAHEVEGLKRAVNAMSLKMR